MSVEERCQVMARELKSGKRGWYLNSFPDSNYFFAPLRKKRMDEQGFGKHTPTTKEEVLWLLKQGQIENTEVARLTIDAFEKM